MCLCVFNESDYFHVQGILLFFLFLDTFRIKGTLLFLPFLNTFRIEYAHKKWNHCDDQPRLEPACWALTMMLIMIMMRFNIQPNPGDCDERDGEVEYDKRQSPGSLQES